MLRKSEQETLVLCCVMQQMCTYHQRYIGRYTTFCTLTSNVFVLSLQKLLHVNLLASKIFKRITKFWKICVPLTQSTRKHCSKM